MSNPLFQLIVMVKILLRGSERSWRLRDHAWNAERKAVESLTAEKESHAFRETKAANIPVTYVADGVIYQEADGKCVAIGSVAPRVRVIKKK